MSNPPARFQDRTFEQPEIHFLEIRGTGITGKWLFEIRALEKAGPHTRRARFLVEFLPKARRLSRLAMVGQGPELSLEEATGLLAVPDDLKTAFERFIIAECARRRTALRRTKQGPGYLLRQLATLLVNHEVRPSAQAEQELTGIIRRYLEQPAFIHRVSGATDKYHFGDEHIGRFFLKETPAF